tara:strand:+ start:13010 stop:13387 length:378 start_codon:yes stop_codon:yes gene_type:complete
VVKKRTLVNDLLEQEDVNRILTFFKKNANFVKKRLGKFEEPYSEISQNHKQVMIKVLLPDVSKNNLQLKMNDRLIEIKAEQKKIKWRPAKTFYRAIDLPSNANIKNAVAQYKKNKLKIVIPKLKP